VHREGEHEKACEDGGERGRVARDNDDGGDHKASWTRGILTWVAVRVDGALGERLRDLDAAADMESA
jgi:hypothetical protein